MGKFYRKKCNFHNFFRLYRNKVHNLQKKDVGQTANLTGNLKE